MQTRAALVSRLAQKPKLNPRCFVSIVDCDEIVVGLKNIIGVIFSKDEARDLANYMDEDKSGDIDEQEFC